MTEFEGKFSCRYGHWHDTEHDVNMCQNPDYERGYDLAGNRIWIHKSQVRFTRNIFAPRNPAFTGTMKDIAHGWRLIGQEKRNAILVEDGRMTTEEFEKTKEYNEYDLKCIDKAREVEKKRQVTREEKKKEQEELLKRQKNKRRI
jgi:hypothetical protein